MPKPYPKHTFRLRWILLTIYVVIGGVIVGNCFLHLGHSPYCSYAFYLILPAGFVVVTLLNALIPWSMIPPGFGLLRSSIELILIPIPFVAAAAQYYLVGLLLDKLVESWRRKPSLDN